MLLWFGLITMCSRFQGSYFEETISSLSAGRVPGARRIADDLFDQVDTHASEPR
jgi:hypothetical protein